MSSTPPRPAHIEEWQEDHGRKRGWARRKGPMPRRVTSARPAQLSETFESAEILTKFPGSVGDLRLSTAAVAVAKGSGICALTEVLGGGGGADEQGGGGVDIKPLIDVDFSGLQVFGWQDGPNYIDAGFHRLKILHAASEFSVGFGISGGGLTGLSLFSGLLLDTVIEVYLDSHFEKHIHEEKKLLTLRKDHVIVVGVVPIHLAATGDLYVGVDLDAQVNLSMDAGAKASFKAGLAFRFDGETFHNLSGFEPPSLEPIPDSPNLDLNGSIVVKGYVRPETHFFAGILFRGLTADLGLTSEAFTRFHAAGRLKPIPCFQWGIDAGLKVDLATKVELFGFDLFDHTSQLVNEEELNLLGGETSCTAPPVARVSHRVVPLDNERYEVELDASESYDPDGGPLRFRWDFDADGQCDRSTLENPRTTVIVDHLCPLKGVIGNGGAIGLVDEDRELCYRGRDMRLQVTDDEGVTVSRRFVVVLSE